MRLISILYLYTAQCFAQARLCYIILMIPLHLVLNKTDEMTASFFYKYLIWFVYCIAIHQKLKKSWSSSIVNWWCYSLQHSIVYILPKFPGYIKSEINTEFTRQCVLRPRGTNKKYGHCHNCNFHWFSFW